jgi:MOSC domain-containing protein YiiM
VAAVSCNDTYAFTKPVRDEIVLIAGVGVKGDVHAGVHVKHRGRVRNDPTQPNFRQVHLIQQELFAEVGAKGYAVAAGNLGENVTTNGIDLLALPVGTILRFGPPPAAAGRVGGRGGAVAVAHEGGAKGSERSLTALEGPAQGMAGSAVPVAVAAGSDGAAPTVPGPQAALASQRASVSEARASAGARASVSEARASASGALAAVLEVAAATELDRPTAASAVAVAAAAARDTGDDPRPAIVLAGLRSPCGQINGFRQGLLKEVVGRDDDDTVVYKAGVMAVVLRGGSIRPGDAVTAELPPPPHAPLERV